MMHFYSHKRLLIFLFSNSRNYSIDTPLTIVKPFQDKHNPVSGQAIFLLLSKKNIIKVGLNCVYKNLQ